MTDSTPRTEAARTLIERYAALGNDLDIFAGILAIEAEAATHGAEKALLLIKEAREVHEAQARTEALDVEALRKQTPRGNFDVGWNAALDAILAAKETP